MPLAVTCSASIDRTTTRSAKGCRFTNSPPDWHSCSLSAQRLPPGPAGFKRRQALLQGGVLDDLAEVDHGDRVVEGDLARVDVRQEVEGVLDEPELRVVPLDLALAQLAHGLDVDLVDDRREDALPRPVAVADRHPDQEALLVLVGLVAEPDRRR